MYGYQRETSPFLDELASSGIIFENAFINTLGTAPSHTTMLTSLYQETHRVGYETAEGAAPLTPIPRQVVMLQEALSSNGYVTLSVTDGGGVGHQYDFGRGFHEFDPDGRGVVSGSAKMVDLVRRYRAARQPIFVFYHTYEIHSPYTPPTELLAKFGDFDSDFEPSNANLGKFAYSAHLLGQEDFDFMNAAYDAEILFTDGVLRDLFAELEALGFFENCLVVVTSDHGEEFGEHGGLLHQGLLYEELLRIPLLVAGTRVPEGIVDGRIVSTIDIAPTILSYASLEIPDDMEGRDLLQSQGVPDEAWNEVYAQFGWRRRALRTKRWKLIITEPRQLELFDLHQDPGERVNVAEENRERVASMRRRLDEWARSRPKLYIDEEAIQFTEQQRKELEALGYTVK
jgi:arylsulfatase A-like enzyme